MDRLDTYERIPEGMREYLSHYGWHFSPKLAEYATNPKRMKNADGTSHHWTHEQVKELLERNESCPPSLPTALPAAYICR